MPAGSAVLNYDAENRQKSATNPPAYGGGTVYYQYDGNGKRVEKAMDSGLTVYVYDTFGKLAAEYTNFPNPSPACATCYLTHDHLGSTRMVTDQAANLISRHDFLPFGEEIQGGAVGRDNHFAQSDLVKQLFTGKGTRCRIRPRLLRGQILRLGAGTVYQPGRTYNRPIC
jgi:YD repeat-containing protein